MRTLATDILTVREMCVTQRVAILSLENGGSRELMGNLDAERARYTGMLKVADALLDLPEGFEQDVQRAAEARYKELLEMVARIHPHSKGGG